LKFTKNRIILEVDMIQETEVLSKIINSKLIDYYRSFPKITDVNIRFEEIDNDKEFTEREVRAANRYNPDDSGDFVIYLGRKWKEMDLAHELLHGKIMLVDRYNIINCNSPICQLLRDYLEDVVIHTETFKKFGIIPFDDEYSSMISRLTPALFRGEGLTDKYWDEKEPKPECGQFKNALLYVQVCHFEYLFNTVDFTKFLNAFIKKYRQKKELYWGREIFEICKTNNYFEDKLSYENGITKIMEIYKPFLPNEKLIKRYERGESVFLLV
jgi:hypothetical protein